MPLSIEQHGPDVLIWIRAVPGASREGIAGAIGERLKVRVGAPPEGGRANRAVCAVLARALGARPRNLSIERGRSSTDKVVRVLGAATDEVARSLREAQHGR